jgi:hypothetical protein
VRRASKKVGNRIVLYIAERPDYAFPNAAEKTHAQWGRSMEGASRYKAFRKAIVVLKLMWMMSRMGREGCRMGLADQECAASTQAAG